MYVDLVEEKSLGYFELDEESAYPPGSMPVWVTVAEGVTATEVLDYLANGTEYGERLLEGQFQMTELCNAQKKVWELR